MVHWLYRYGTADKTNFDSTNWFRFGGSWWYEGEHENTHKLYSLSWRIVIEKMPTKFLKEIDRFIVKEEIVNKH